VINARPALCLTQRLDRVAMRAIRIDIDGPNYRQQVARDRQQRRGKLPDEPAEAEAEPEQ